jgi:hypothetical protein
LTHSPIRPQYHGHGAQHEHDGAPGGGFRKNVGRAARTESRLAASATESSGEIGSFAALEQHDDDQHQAIQNKKACQQPTGEPETKYYDSDADEQRDCPLHCSFRFHTCPLSKNQKSQPCGAT